jgi:hypothetical protein
MQRCKKDATQPNENIWQRRKKKENNKNTCLTEISTDPGSQRLLPQIA